MLVFLAMKRKVADTPGSIAIAGLTEIFAENGLCHERMLGALMIKMGDKEG